MFGHLGSVIPVGLSDALLAVSSPDGLSAWQSVVGEFRRTVSDPLAGWPVIAVAAGFLAIMWVNIRVARRVLASWDAHHPGPDPVDHHV